MRHLFVLVSLLLCSETSFATSIRDDILSQVPSELTAIDFKQTPEQLKEKLKEHIVKSDHKSLFLKYKSDMQNATIGMKDNQIEYIYFKFDKSADSNLFQKVYNQLTKEEKAKFENQQSDRSKHSSGREIELDLPDESLKVIFKNNSKKTVDSVIIWKAKGEQI